MRKPARKWKRCSGARPFGLPAVMPPGTSLKRSVRIDLISGRRSLGGTDGDDGEPVDTPVICGKIDRLPDGKAEQGGSDWRENGHLALRNVRIAGIDQRHASCRAIVGPVFHVGTHLNGIWRHGLGRHHSRPLQFAQEFINQFGLTVEQSVGKLRQPLMVRLADDDVGLGHFLLVHFTTHAAVAEDALLAPLEPMRIFELMLIC